MDKDRSAQPSQRRATRRMTASQGPAVGAAIIEFLNIDLDVRSRHSLAPLATAWPRAQRPLRLDGRPHPHWLILSGPGLVERAEAAARFLLKQVEDLKGAARRSWNLASSRTFDIGIQAGTHPGVFEQVLHPKTMSRIASIGGRLKITIYAPRAPEEGTRSATPPSKELHLTKAALARNRGLRR